MYVQKNNHIQQDLKAIWAKHKIDDLGISHYHPLLCHMIDTACVVKALWKYALHNGFKTWITRQLTTNSDEVTGNILAFWSGLHDLGKASPSFQKRSDKIKELLQSMGFSFPNGDAPHGLISTVTVEEILQNEFNYSLPTTKLVSTIIGGHHGVFARSIDINNIGNDAKGGKCWDQARRDSAIILAELLGIDPHYQIGKFDNAVAVAIAGLISVADWIASNDKEFFPYCENAEENVDLSTYQKRSEEQAAKALEKLCWNQWKPPDERKNLIDLFETFRKNNPYPVQKLIEELSPKLSQPSLAIIEAPTGEGKTEAALFLADQWAAGLKQKGFYFALPTKATSNQMFKRTKDFLDNSYDDKEKINLMLQHGHAALSSEFEQLRKYADSFYNLDAIEDENEKKMGESSVLAAEWFTYRKRGFIAPFGVGTIDQALLSVLQTKHFFVRLFGLAHKTVIIDEVHAYDTYMTSLLERLLEWLAALQCPIILLSATLPNDKRKALITAYRKGLGKDDKDKVYLSAQYPRVTWTNKVQIKDKHVNTSRHNTRTINLKWVGGQIPIEQEKKEFELGKNLKDALEGGGCAAVICNTVNRAQEMYKALKYYFPEKELKLLHARFIFKDRQDRERDVLKWFGPPEKSKRPKKKVLVATQIIEQSLDLDFDLMVTDIAPVDLMLQRAGRLHRHNRNDRPNKLNEPTLWIMQPKQVESPPMFEPGTAIIYDEHILLRTWLALKDQHTISIPSEVERFIEDVYGEKVCPEALPEGIKQKWEETRKILERKINSEKSEAEDRWVKHPSYSGALWRLAPNCLAEDKPEFHAQHQALTRLAQPTINIVCLSQDHEFELNNKLDINRTKELLGYSVSISHRGIFNKLMEISIPNCWRKSPLLRHHKPVIFEEGYTTLGKYTLHYDAHLGLVIKKEE